jgi:ER lumen protein retaining receptor|eukprot:TRINITY_DN71542_c0_g1_i1.p1 TRINITY_DN71542_c0_g1~~TRINITY_DN71542_c0_g1_i1.p1  ORF type:complete len:221 (+),score=26.03 TRINITY_DN71542_c0_g1_i1:106-768(+)
MEIFLFILGYYVQVAASCLLVFKIHKQRSIYGLSVDTQLCYLLSIVVRWVWVMETRLVETKLAYLELILSTVAASGLSFLCYQYNHTTSKQPNKFLRIYFTAPAALVLALIFHPGDDWISMQVLIAFTNYLEAFALLPQLDLMRKMHEIEPLTSHYVGLIVVARFVRMLFWIKMTMLGEHFLQLMFSDICHTLLSADYMYLWFRKLKDGGRLVYSHSLSV